MNVTSVLLFGILMQAAPEDPNSKAKPDMGVAIGKPPKNDEWAFKDQGFFNGTALSVAHKVDELGIDILAQENGTGSFDAKAAADGLYKDIMAANGVTEAKKVDSRTSKLPGGGGGGANANYIEMTFKRNEKLMDLYLGQVRRTEDIQLKSQERLVELQRMTTIGQSKTLADFMLNAKQWWSGPTPSDQLQEGDKPGMH